ncbi:hypothetical protein OAE55_06930 [Gammaproteobacteria bacterium]|nr:hypothetical protein [Gammaproteobacteria bacterium]
MKSDTRKLYESGEAATNSFLSNKEHETKEFYAVTLSPLESKIHSKGIWYDIDARERLVISLWNQVKHQLNRNLSNNYRRYPDKQLKDFVAIEHYDKNQKALIKPHLHGTLAIPKELKQAFEESFDERGSLKLALFDTDIKSVFVKHIPSPDDLNLWNGYVLKQQFGVINK